MKKRVLSGVAPSGNLHIGNYLGAIKQWVELQHEHESLFCVVDLHAITTRQDPRKLREKIREVAALYIACGIDPDVSTVFVQSSVPEHAELAWVLGTFTQLGELERMTQYKDKVKLKKENANAGLFQYPVLMAADILLYQTNFVPVGADQKQHVELTRDIAERMNHQFEQNLFVLPEVMNPKAGARVMGLDDPTKKMSKSAVSPWNYVAFTDSPETIRKKIKKAVTDSGSEIRAADDKPAVQNLLTIFSAVSGRSIAQLERDYTGKGYGDFKADLAEALVQWMEPVQSRLNDLIAHPKKLDALLDAGAERAHDIARRTLGDVYDAIGLGYK